MPSGRVHHVLCVACRAPATTLYAYPEPRCGIAAVVIRDGARIAVSCTEAPGNRDCGLGVHYDGHVLLRFESAGTLRAARQGQTGRA